jgi:hypothetical protein
MKKAAPEAARIGKRQASYLDSPSFFLAAAVAALAASSADDASADGAGAAGAAGGVTAAGGGATTAGADSSFFPHALKVKAAEAINEASRRDFFIA